MYWLPRGWVPGYVEWVLCFPKAPMGSVSIQIWGIACASVITMVGSAAAASFVLLREEKVESKDAQQKSSGGRNEGKKTL